MFVLSSVVSTSASDCLQSHFLNDMSSRMQNSTRSLA